MRLFWPIFCPYGGRHLYKCKTHLLFVVSECCLLRVASDAPAIIIPMMKVANITIVAAILPILFFC